MLSSDKSLEKLLGNTEDFDEISAITNIETQGINF